MDVSGRIEALDITIFDGIPSLTTREDRRTLLAVQRATAQLHGRYSYLEIGSHLGGTIQPHLLDSRCEKIYSIDPRPEAQADERAPGYVDRYEDNSTARMLALLSQLRAEQVAKVECFECCSWEVPVAAIPIRPHLVFIDGEHTTEAALADFRFALRVVDPRGTILFHDYGIVHRAVRRACAGLRKGRVAYRALKLGGDVFGIFLASDLADGDPELAALADRNRSYALRFNLRRLERWLRGGVRRIREPRS